jgi:hypothetical protein
MRIFDCFTFFNEIFLLKVRCEELKSLNVTHVLVESETTFTGNKKGLVFSKNKDDFSQYDIHGFVAELPNNGNAWDNEKAQRNYILTALNELGAQDDDIIIVSDLDEIPKAESIKDYLPDENLTALRVDTYRYYLNCLEAKQNWIMPRICRFKYLKSRTPDAIRNSGYEHTIGNSGWHMSYVCNVEELKYKVESFSHVELNTDEFKDKLEYKRGSCQSLFGTDFWQVVDIDENLPKYVQDNKEEFKHLIFRK